MINFQPNLNPDDVFHEKAAAQLAALTDVSLDNCYRIVCEIDGRVAIQALIELLKIGATSADSLQIYEALSEIEMLKPPSFQKKK